MPYSTTVKTQLGIDPDVPATGLPAPLTTTIYNGYISDVNTDLLARQNSKSITLTADETSKVGINHRNMKKFILLAYIILLELGCNKKEISSDCFANLTDDIHIKQLVNNKYVIYTTYINDDNETKTAYLLKCFISGDKHYWYSINNYYIKEIQFTDSCSAKERYFEYLRYKNNSH